jgi:chromosome segregation ATPase
MSFIEFQPFVAVLSEMGDRIKSQMTELRKHQEHLEGLVKERTSGLEEKTIELEQANVRLKEKTEKLARMNKLFVDRELRMKELKEEIKKLKKKMQ